MWEGTGMEDRARFWANKATRQTSKVTGFTVRTGFTVAVTIAITLLAATTWGQRRSHYPVPPAPADSRQPEATPKVQAKPNPVELERKGRELAGLASTIPADVQQVNKGILPKDMVEKLKRIEKLSKQLRSEVGP
jgi:hypothetical protein